MPAFTARKTGKSLFIALLTLLPVFSFSCSKRPAYPTPPVSGGSVRIKVSALAGDVPSFFTVMKDGKQIDFFVVRTGNEVQSYFNACARCGPKKLGYYFQNGRIYCRACGVSYAPGNLKGIGSCYPLPLKGALSGGYYLIPIQAVYAGGAYF
ncbi:MAG: Fe-S-containing protein [Nitrospiraceae bacterium]|nr:Fe-S-containing protein [Nitrospiraceae bacterium]